MPTNGFRSISKILVALLFVVVICGPSALLRAADHREAPKVDAVPEGDITDVFLFTDPNDASRVVMIMNVNPFANPAENPSFSFSPELLYQFKIDNDGDAREDKVIQILFTGVGTGQTVQVFGPTTPRQTGARNALLPGQASASGKFGQVIGNASGVLAFAGLRDDPFVFDVSQFFRILNNSQDVFRAIPSAGFRGRPVHADGTSGVDGFGGFNLTSIVVSLPKSMVRGNTSKINMWATVSEQLPPRRGGRNWVQFERMGQQAFATVFIPGGLPRDLENEEIPEHDVANYSKLIPDALTTKDNDGTGNTIAGRATLLSNSGLATLPNGAPLLLPANFPNNNKDLLRIALLPDVLRFDLDLAANNLAIGQFGLQNGRRLTDPVIDIALQLLRQLADVHFPDPSFPGGGPLGNRGALDCTVFPACPDRRVLVVVQGTDWIKPDAQLLDFTTSGNDRQFLTTFPYIAAPHPLPGDAGTIGFPAQQ